MWTSDLRVNETTPQQAPEKYFLGVHEQVFMRRISAASQSRWSARGDGIAIPLARRPPLPLRRRAVNSAPSSSLVRPATSCARNVSSYPRSSSNSYHAANAGGPKQLRALAEELDARRRVNLRRQCPPQQNVNAAVE